MIAGAAALAIGIAGVFNRASAEVVTVSPLDPALGFNLFVEGDTALAEHEIEGPVATGGDLVVQGLYEVDVHGAADFVYGDDAEPSALVVGGGIDYGRSTEDGIVRVLNGGYVKIGDLTGSEVINTDENNASVDTRVVPEGEGYEGSPRIELTVTQPEDSVESSPIDFGTAFSTMRSNSATLAACQNTVTMTDSRDWGQPVAKGEVQPGQQIFIELTAGQTNVLNVTGEDLNNMADLTFIDQPSADTPLLINVDTSAAGGVFDWDVAPQAGISGQQAPYILWNFNDATDLTIAGGDTVEGSIYAPNADFTDLSITNVEGQIVAANAQIGTVSDNSGEIHHYPFEAELTCDTEVDPSPTTDEPTTDEPTTDQPTTDHPTTDEPTTEAPTSGAPTTADSVVPSDIGTDGQRTPAGLSTTGASLTGLGIAALVLVAGGTAALVASRRRNRSTE